MRSGAPINPLPARGRVSCRSVPGE